MGSLEKRKQGFTLRAFRNLLRPLVECLDWIIPKKRNLWVFPVCHLRHVLIDNPFFLYEVAVTQPDLEIRVLGLDLTQKEHDPYRRHLSSMMSFSGLWYLLRAEVIVVRHGLADLFWIGVSAKNHNVINLWHGIPLKKMRFSAADQFDRKWLERERDNITAIISSSTIDQKAMADAHDLTKEKVWVTGLPRNDFLTPSYRGLIKSDVSHVVPSGKTFILYAPTFRKETHGMYNFAPEELKALKELLKTHDAILGIRLHMRNELSSDLKSIVDGVTILDLGAEVVPEAQVLLKRADILVTDYSSMWVDYLLMGRPILGFCHDYDHYMRNDRGFIYDYQDIFPGPISKDFIEFLTSLKDAFEGSVTQEISERTENARKIFHKFSNDGLNSRRVLEKIRSL